MVLLYIWVDLPQNMYFDYAWHWTIKYFTSSYFLKHTHVSLGYCITNLCHKRKKKHLKVSEKKIYLWKFLRNNLFLFWKAAVLYSFPLLILTVPLSNVCHPPLFKEQIPKEVTLFIRKYIEQINFSIST